MSLMQSILQYQGVSKTFVNECMLRAEMCKNKEDWLFVHEGPCSESADPEEPNNSYDQTAYAHLLYMLLNRMRESQSNPIPASGEVKQTSLSNYR